MNIIAWNIQQGGGPEERIERIVATLLPRNPDVIVLSEYQNTKCSGLLLNRLHEAGYKHQERSTPPGLFGGVAIVSRHLLESGVRSPELEPFAWRYVHVIAPALDLEICGVYGPLPRDSHDEFWRAALSALAAVSHRNILVIGDFNTGVPLVDTPVNVLSCSEHFCELPNRGYTDLWRQHAGTGAREYTWVGRINPYRLDHAFGTRAVVARLRNCSYSHTERESRLSDHSLISVELADASV